MDEGAPRALTGVGELADELERLREEVQRLTARVDGFEDRLAGGAATARTAEEGGEPTEVAADPLAPSDPVALATSSPARLTLGGRLLLVLAGAFLLRAATEGGQLPPALGIAAGMLYALAWLPAAHRAGRRGDGAGAVFHALATLLVAYPLLFEAAQRFHVLGAGSSALALAGVTALLLHAGWRQRSPAVAWLALVATVVTATALAAVTAAPATFTALLVGFAGASLALGEQRGWRPLGAVSAAVADLAVALLTLATLVPHPLAPLAAVPVQLSLLLLYLGFTASLASRGVMPGWPLRLQTTGALVVGWGGALVTARIGGGELQLAVGVLGLLLAVATEGLVWWRLAVAPAALSRLFLFAATALFLGGTLLLLAEPAATWAAVAIVTTWLGARHGRPAVELQGALLAAAALLGSGALAAATAGLLRPAVPPPAWSATALLSLVAAAACLAALATSVRERSLARDLAVAVLLGLLVWTGVGGTVVSIFRGFAPGGGVAAALGTTLLAACAVPLAYAGRGARLPSAGWLVYPLLGITTFKLLLVDLPGGGRSPSSSPLPRWGEPCSRRRERRDAGSESRGCGPLGVGYPPAGEEVAPSGALPGTSRRRPSRRSSRRIPPRRKLRRKAAGGNSSALSLIVPSEKRRISPSRRRWVCGSRGPAPLRRGLAGWRAPRRGEPARPPPWQARSARSAT